MYARIILCDTIIYNNINIVKQNKDEHNNLISNIKIIIIIILHACYIIFDILLKFLHLQLLYFIY